MFMEILRWVMTIVGTGIIVWFVYLWIDEIKLDAFIDGWYACEEKKMIQKINEVYKEVKRDTGL